MRRRKIYGKPVWHPNIDFVEGENPWVTFMKNRVKKNNSLNIAVTAECGKGKSWLVLAIARLYNPNWTLDNCYFSCARLIRDINDDKFKPGDLIMLDEGGIDMDSQQWQSKINQAMGHFFQTARSKRLIVLITLPYLSFLSKRIRTLVNAKWEVKGYRDNITRCVPLYLEYNDEVDKQYKKRLVVRKNGSKGYCNSILIPKAPKELTEPYEIKKRAFQYQLYEKLGKELEHFEQKQAKKSDDTKELTAKQKVVVNLIKEGLNMDQMTSSLNITKQGVYDFFKAIKKKGYAIEAEKLDENVVKRYHISEKA